MAVLVKRKLLNDQKVYIIGVIRGDNFSFKFNKDLDFLSKFIKVKDNEIKLGLKTIGHIKGKNFEITHPMTTLEIKLLRAIYNNMVSLGLSNFDIEEYADIIDRVLKKNLELLNRKDHIKPDDMIELHTHFIEVLSSEEFVEFMSNRKIKFPMNDFGYFDMNGKGYTLHQIKLKGWTQNLLNAFRIDVSQKVGFEVLQEKINNRQKMMELLGRNEEPEILLTDEYTKAKKANDEEISLIEEKISMLKRDKQNLKNIINFFNNLLKGSKVKLTFEPGSPDIEKIIEKVREYISKLPDNLSDKNKNDISELLERIKLKRQEKVDDYEDTVDEKKRREEFANHYINGYVYNLLFEKVADKLKREDVKYAELSFSNSNRIKYIASKNENIKNVRFLFSVHRDAKKDAKDVGGMRAYTRYARELEELLSKRMIMGTDIMGQEFPFDAKSYDNFKDKLELILPVLHIHPGSVLRVHASEDKNCTDNLFKTLTAIKEVNNKLGKSYKDITGKEWGQIPPPIIRIGHAINIKQNKELIDLIKSFGPGNVIVEFCISSNYALSNIEDFSDLPLNYYKDNNIAYTVSTDGGGMYVTSVNQDRNIVHNLMDEDGNTITANDTGELPDKATKEDLAALKKFMKHKKEEPRPDNSAKSQEEALERENSLFGTTDERRKVQIEVERLQRYVSEMDLEYDFDIAEFNRTINYILKENISDPARAKQYLFSYERFYLPNIESYLKEEEYLLTSRRKDFTDGIWPKGPKTSEFFEEKYTRQKTSEVYKEATKHFDFGEFTAALIEEKTLLGGLSYEEMVRAELKRLYAYAAKNMIDISVFRDKIDLIEKSISSGTIEAEIYLYLLEKEISSDFSTQLKSVEYLDGKKADNPYDLGKEFVEEFERIKKIYKQDEFKKNR